MVVDDILLADPAEVARVVEGRHCDPFSFLGLHKTADGYVVRTYQPQVTSVSVVFRNGETHLLQQVSEGFFADLLARKGPRPRYHLRLETPDGCEDIEDPYRFGLMLPADDITSLRAGRHWHAYEVLGAHQGALEGVEGVSFAVWAPDAEQVALVGDFNDWDRRRHPMRLRYEAGIWEIFLPERMEDIAYGFAITPPGESHSLIRPDPYALICDGEDGRSTRLTSPLPSPPKKERAEKLDSDGPDFIYRAQLNEWIGDNEDGFEACAQTLIPYVTDMGFTHLQLASPCTMGPMGAPRLPFALPKAQGGREGFRALIEAAQKAGLKVIIELNIAFFDGGEYGLSQYDGTALFENADPVKAARANGTDRLYNHVRYEASNYLFANALYWVHEFGVDGLALTQLEEALYLDYGKKEGAWHPNAADGNTNTAALFFIRQLNELLVSDYPGRLRLSGSPARWPGMTAPTRYGGMGFSTVRNDSLFDALISADSNPSHFAAHVAGDIARCLVEKTIFSLQLPIDEGTNLDAIRAALAVLYALPGGVRLPSSFEITPLAQAKAEGMDWAALATPENSSFKYYIQALNRTLAYQRTTAAPFDFEWMIPPEKGGQYADGVFAFVRQGTGAKGLLVVANMGGSVADDIVLTPPTNHRYCEIIKSSGPTPFAAPTGQQAITYPPSEGVKGMPFTLSLPPHTTIILQADE